MANGDQALSVILDEVDAVLAKEKTLDFSKCSVDASVPEAMFLLLKLQRYSLKNASRTNTLGIAGTTSGVSAAILIIANFIMQHLGII